MTLDHFGHVSEFPRHSECPFSDPNLGLLKLHEGLRVFFKLHKAEMKLHMRSIKKTEFSGKLHRHFHLLIPLFFIASSTCGLLELVAIDAVNIH